MITAIVGANWGDEGKGKITDTFAAKSDLVIRFQGGSNAGHTILNQHGRFALHQLPSGIFYPKVLNLIANGCALNVDYLIKEIAEVKKQNVDFSLYVSEKVQILLPIHVLLDTYQEEYLKEEKFGSTKSGIGPFFADKYAKAGIQLWQLYEDPQLKQKAVHLLKKINTLFVHLYHKPAYPLEMLLEDLERYKKAMTPYRVNSDALLRDAIKEHKKILLEGQLGALKDPDHGIYPYVTSSSTLAGYASVGAGVPPYLIQNIIAVTKAYSSAVGEGPFVSEIFGEEAEELRKRGGDRGEYGATTGRPRRVGWFDAVATRQGAFLQGATALAVTCLDVLSYLKEIPMCTGYQLDGQVTDEFGVTSALYKAKPVWQVFEGWQSDIKGITDYQKLPPQAKTYLKAIEAFCKVPVRYISTGPRREDLIEVDSLGEI